MLDQAFGWIGRLVEFVGSWIPRPLPIWHTQVGVMFSTNCYLILWERYWWVSFGALHVTRPPKKLKGGRFYWYIPALTQICIYSKLPLPLNLGEFPIDLPGATAIIDGAMTYRIFDAMRAAHRADDLEFSLQTIATPSFRKIFLEHATSKEDLLEAFTNGKIDRALCEELNRRARKYGVRFDETAIIAGRGRVLHHTGTGLSVSITHGIGEE